VQYKQLKINRGIGYPLSTSSFYRTVFAIEQDQQVGDILLGGQMSNLFNPTAWLIQTGFIFMLLLLAIPVLRTILGIFLLLLARVFTEPNSLLQRAGVRTLPKFVQALLGISIGLSGVIATPAYASDELTIDRIATYQTEQTPSSSSTHRPAITSYEVQVGDSLWVIAAKFLKATETEPTASQIDQAWRLIWAANRNVIGDNPSFIQAGIVIQIPTEIQHNVV
jgi:nucleoid-associated protein YgaU